MLCRNNQSLHACTPGCAQSVCLDRGLRRRIKRTMQFAVRDIRLPESTDIEHIDGKDDMGVLTLKARASSCYPDALAPFCMHVSVRAVAPFNW